MASQEELDRQNEINDEKNEQISLEKELIAILVRRAGIDSSILSDQQDISNVLKDQVKFLKFQNAEKTLLTSLTTKINNIAKDSYTISQDQYGLEQTNNKLAKDRQTLEASLLLLDQQQVKFSEENDELSQSIANSIGEQVKQTKILLDNLDKIEKTSNAVSKNFGVKTFGALSDITKKIPGLSRFSEPFQQASEAARSAAANIELSDKKGMSGFSKGLAGVTAGFKSLGPALTKALGPVVLIAELIKGIMQADKETTELQKSMGLTKDQASGFRMNLASAAASSNNLNITTTKLLETYNSINKQFGFVARFSDETLVNTTRLTKQVGLSAEAANALAGLTERQGSNAEELYETTVGTVLQLQKQSGIQIDQREIFEQIGKTTGTIRANLGSNPITIATAIQKSKEFGASLQDVANAGKALLDFESSITSELEAELLLGKNINLERARAAALAGDQVTLAQELQQQAGSFSDFSAMNVIQQEALAKAMGMSSDQLADILYQQDLQTKGAEKVRAELMATGQEDAVRALDAQSAQDKFNATVEKLQGVFADVGTAFMPILQLFGDLLNIVNLIIAPITDLVQLIVATSRLIGGNSSAFSEIKFSTPQAFGMETADDAVIPAGYGETIIKKGKDTIALNNNDTVVAGTNLMGSTQSSPVQDNTETKRTNQLLERLLNQPAVFKIGTDEFYTATSKYSYQIQ
jgi:plasmid maintenance system antidote protein VapI